MSKLMVGHAFNLKNIMDNYPRNTLSMSEKELKEHGITSKVNLVEEIASCALKMIMDDVIENGTRFNFPTPKPAYIQMDGVYADNFKQAKRNGAFREVDPFKSDMCGFKPMYWFQNNKRWVKKPISIDAKRTEIITQKTNEGFKY